MTRKSGFTLIELVVTVALAAIVLTVGVPAFGTFIKNNRLITSTNALVGALNLARSEAIKRNVRVSVCKSSDGAACTGTGNWEQGWLVFVDSDNDATYDNGTETLLRVQDNIKGNVTMAGNANVSTYVSYVSSGRSQLIDGAFQAGTIKICDDRTGNVGRQIVISNTGRMHLDSQISCP